MKKVKFTKDEHIYFNKYYGNPHFPNIKPVDDNCYKNDKQVRFDIMEDYIIVVGSLGIGKSLYSKIMCKFNKNIQYYSEQRLDVIYRRIRQEAIKIIELREVIL